MANIAINIVVLNEDKISSLCNNSLYHLNVNPTQLPFKRESLMKIPLIQQLVRKEIEILMPNKIS